MAPLSSLTTRLLDGNRRHYDGAPTEHKWPARCYRWWLAHYYNLLIPAGASVLEIGCGNGTLLSLLRTRNVAGVDLSADQLAAAAARVPYGRFYHQAGADLAVPATFAYI